MHICLYVDNIGSARHTPADIYKRLDAFLHEALQDQAPTFENLSPASLLAPGQRCDLYVIDIRNLVAEGADVSYLVNPLWSAVLARPSTWFIWIGTATTGAFWQAAPPSQKAKMSLKNVAVLDSFNGKALRTILGLGENPGAHDVGDVWGYILGEERA